MKRYVTEKAIEALVQSYRDVRADQRRATTNEAREYFFGKKIGMIEAFANLCNLDWIRAEAILKTRADALDKTPNPENAQ